MASPQAPIARKRAPTGGLTPRPQNSYVNFDRFRWAVRPRMPDRCDIISRFSRTPAALSVPHVRAKGAAGASMDQIDDVLNQDLDPTETREWVESLNAVINHDGT